MDEIIKDFKIGPTVCGLLYVVLFITIICVVKRIISCCVYNQRIRLRDSYEYELYNGGHLTNQLLLPGVRS